MKTPVPSGCKTRPFFNLDITRKFTLLLFLLSVVGITAHAQSDYFITADDGTKLHVQEFGRGTPVVLLGGGPGINGQYLQPVWTELAKQNRCIVLHQRGTEKSVLNKVDSSTVNIRLYVADIEKLRKHLKLDRITLLGHSWGSSLAIMYASIHPDNVESLILADPGTPTGKDIYYVMDNVKMRLTNEELKEMQTPDSLGRLKMSVYWPGYFYNHKKGEDTRYMVDAPGFEGQKDIANILMPQYYSASDDIALGLKKYKGAVYLIQGRQDPMDASTAFEIKNILPGTVIHFVEKSGHFPWLEGDEQATDFFANIKQWLRQP